MPCPAQISRRKVLSISATALGAISAGCTTVTSKGATGVLVRNESNTGKSVKVTILRSADERQQLGTTLALDVGEQVAPTASNKLPVGTDYTVEIDVENGPTRTYYWPDVSLKLAPLHVIISCDSRIYFELQSNSPS